MPSDEDGWDSSSTESGFYNSDGEEESEKGKDVEDKTKEDDEEKETKNDDDEKSKEKAVAQGVYASQSCPGVVGQPDHEKEEKDEKDEKVVPEVAVPTDVAEGNECILVSNGFLASKHNQTYVNRRLCSNNRWPSCCCGC